MKKFNITVNGQAYEVEVEEVGGAAAAPRAAAPKAAPAPAAAPAAAAAAGETAIAAPMPGKVLKVNVTVGQAVNAGDNLLILEAMKMQNEIVAPVDGSVKAINVAAGQAVQAGEVLAVIG